MKSASEIRVGLLAYGAIGDEHNQAVLATPGLNTIAVCDQRAERDTIKSFGKVPV